MRIAFAGTPEFAVPPLAALCRAAPVHQVVGVLTQPDRPAGRGQKLAQGPVKTFALAAGLPVAQPVTLRDDAGRAPLLAWQPDLLVVVAYGLILDDLREHLPGRPGRVYGTRELVLHRHCVAVYRVQGDEVHVLTLFHTAQRR